MIREFRKIIVEGIELCICAGETDRCLFMLHGIGSNCTSFRELANQLPADIELIAWNAPGFGASAPVSTSHPVAQHYASRLHDVVEKLELKRFALLGHSLGTLIATAYAHSYPGKVDCLVLLSCAQGYAMEKGADLPQKTQQRLTDLAAKGPLAFAQERAPRLIHQPERKQRLVNAAIEAMAAINPAGYRQAVHLLAAGNLTQVAARTGIDSLTMSGIEDQVTPIKQSRACHDALVAADVTAKHQFIEVSDAGHLVHQEQAAQVANSILQFTGWDAKSNLESTA